MPAMPPTAPLRALVVDDSSPDGTSEVVARLGDALAEARGRIPVSRGGAAAGAPAGQALDPETVARLHALGYM